MQVVIDSCVFVSGLDPKDVFHRDCKPILDGVVSGELEPVCPLIVLVESTCAIRRRTGQEPEARAVLRALTNLPSVTWLEIAFGFADSASLLGARTGLRGGDAIVAEVAREYDLPLVTKDSEVKERAPKGIRVVDPADLAWPGRVPKP